MLDNTTTKVRRIHFNFLPGGFGVCRLLAPDPG